MIPTTEHPTGQLSMSESDPLVELPWKRQRLSVSREDKTLCAVPSLSESPKLIEQNRDLLDRSRLNIQGRALSTLRQWTRDKALAVAAEYTSSLAGESVTADASHLVAVSGHQPELFHTGVWAKNFALNKIASACGGTALNLIVDNDMCSSAEIRIPQGTRETPYAQLFAFDDLQTPRPWEEVHIQNAEQFRNFGQQITKAMQTWKIRPLIDGFWQDAVDHMTQSTLLGDCLTAARNRLERRWGLNNLELPLSRLCVQDPFLWFASHLMAHAPRFLEIHNTVLQEYKRLYRIRSATHPVPALRSVDGWTESPFWMWRAGEQTRQRIFVRQQQREVWLSDGNDVFAQLPLSPEMDACCAVEVLRELPSQGIRLRTRALTTTLFSRLCLGDLFIHGIGGAKYDEMTDQVIARFWKMRPPAFSVLSATLFLPIAKPYDVTPSDETRLQTMLRDLQYNADRHVHKTADAATQQLIDEKHRLIAEQQAARNEGLSRNQRRLNRQTNVNRFRKLFRINQQLAQCAHDQRELFEHEWQSIKQRLTANSILKDREFPFCLYPEEQIRGFMSGI